MFRRFFIAHKYLGIALMAFGLLALVGPAHFAVAAPNVQPARVPLNAQMQRIVDLVNQRRREAGLLPVTVNPVLMNCAQQYSAVQAAQAGINHTGPDGSTPGQRLNRCGYAWRHYGENLAAGFVNPDEVMQAWMNSPGHRRVILNPRTVEIGLGFTHRDNDPGLYYDYMVMEMGRRW